MAQEGMNTSFTSKQKAMAILFIVVILFLIYQIIGMFGSSDNAKVVPAAPANNKAAMQQAANPGANPQPAGTPNAPTPSPQPQQVQPLKGLVAANSDVLKKQQEQQQQYLNTINELQMLKLNKDIAETNQAIAAAKLATATAEKNIGDLFIKQAPPPPSTSDYANKLVTPATAGQPVQTGPTPVAYVVISVSMQMNRWTAVLGAQGKLYNVSTGDVLPADGWIVQQISKEGVILKKDNETRKISLVPVI